MDRDQSPPYLLFRSQGVKGKDPGSLGHPERPPAMDDADDSSLLESDEKSRRLTASVDAFIRRSELQGKLELAAFARVEQSRAHELEAALLAKDSRLADEEEFLNVQEKQLAEVEGLSASKDAKVVLMESESRTYEKKIGQLEVLLRISERILKAQSSPSADTEVRPHGSPNEFANLRDRDDTIEAISDVKHDRIQGGLHPSTETSTSLGAVASSRDAQQHGTLLDNEETLIAGKKEVGEDRQWETARLHAIIGEAAASKQALEAEMQREQAQLQARLHEAGAIIVDLQTALAAMQDRFLLRVYQLAKARSARAPLQAWRAATVRRAGLHVTETYFLVSSHKRTCKSVLQTWRRQLVLEPAWRCSALDASRSVIATRAERMFASLALQAWRHRIRASAVAALFRGRHRGFLVAFLFRFWMMETGFERRLRHSYKFLMRRTLRLLVSKVLRLWCLQAVSGRTFKDMLNASWAQQECGAQNVLNRLRHALFRANRKLARSTCKEWHALTTSAKFLRRTAAHGGARLRSKIVGGSASNHLQAWGLLVSMGWRRARQSILVRGFNVWLGTARLTLADKLMQRITAFGGARLQNRILGQALFDHFRAWRLFVSVGWPREQRRTLSRFFVEWAIQAKLTLSQRQLVWRAAAYGGARLRKRIRLAVACDHIKAWKNVVCLGRRRVRQRTLARCFDAWGGETLKRYEGRMGLGRQNRAGQLQIRFNLLMHCGDFVLKRIRRLLTTCVAALCQGGRARRKRKAAYRFASHRTIHELHIILCAWADVARAKVLQVRRKNTLHQRIVRRCEAVAFSAWSCSARADAIARSAASSRKGRDKRLPGRQPMEVLNVGQRVVEACGSPTRVSGQVFEAWAQDDSIDVIGKKLLSEILMWRESQAEEEKAIAAKLAALR